MSSAQQVELSARINAAGVVVRAAQARIAFPCAHPLCVPRQVKGAHLIKFVLGRRRQHPRFFKVTGTGMVARLTWGSHGGRLLKAEGTTPQGLQREQRLAATELARCFTVVLEGKVLALMAESQKEKQVWVDGLNAITAGLLMNSKV